MKRIELWINWAEDWLNDVSGKYGGGPLWIKYTLIALWCVVLVVWFNYHIE